jgi:DNA-binding IclR family transcriptional regulator
MKPEWLHEVATERCHRVLDALSLEEWRPARAVARQLEMSLAMASLTLTMLVDRGYIEFRPMKHAGSLYRRKAN